MNKSNIRKANKRRNKIARADVTNSSSGTPPNAQRRMPRWLIAIPCILFMGVATYFVFEYFVWAKVPSALVGKWEVTEGDEVGAVLEFQRDGTFTGYVNIKEKLATINSRVTVSGDTITFVSVHPTTKKQVKATQIIRKLEGDTLVLEDTKTKKVFRLRRIE